MDGFGCEDLRFGQTASVGETIAEADIVLFAAIRADSNLVQLSAEAGAA